MSVPLLEPTKAFAKISENKYAFGFLDKDNIFRYYLEAILPAGVNPSVNRDKALTYLIRRFIVRKKPEIYNAICHLNPSMLRWDYQHFVNYLGLGEENTDYSSDSDDDDRDAKLFSEADQKLSREILNRKKEPKPRVTTLGKRIETLVKKTQKQSLVTSSIENFVEDRQTYFCKLPQEPEQTIKLGKHEFKNELELINIAVKSQTLAIKTIQRNGKTFVEISGNYKGDPIQYALTKQYLLPMFRGISYLVDRFGKQGRKTHRRAPQGLDFINYAEANVKGIPDFYNLSDYSKIDTRALHDNARALKKTLIGFKQSPDMILTHSSESRQFSNFLDYLQFAFSNGIVNFIKHIDDFNKKFPGVLPNNGTPLLPFSHLPFHAVRYAFGEKNPYKDFAIPPLWDAQGRALKPHVGKLVINIHPLSDFVNFDEPNVVPHLTNVGISVPKVIGAEYEVSFLSFVPRERIFREYVIRYPSFHKGYNPKYLAKYGLNPDIFNGFRACILNSATKEKAAEVLKTWLCLFHAIKIMHEVTNEISKNGTMLFFHPDGTFKTSYPSENYESNTQAVAQSKAHGKINLSKAKSLMSDSSSYSGTRGLSYVPDSLQTPPRTPLSKAQLQRTLSLGSGEKAIPYAVVSPNSPFQAMEDAFSEFSDLSFDKDEGQLGWNCFDRAVGLTSRQSLVNYALQGGIEFRRLLTPEIANALAATAAYVSRKDALTENDKKSAVERNKKLIEFFEISKALEDTVDQQQLAIEAEELLVEAASLEQEDNLELRALKDHSLPSSMDWKEACELANAYFDAYENMVEPIRECNDALGRPQGQRLSLDGLDEFFSKEENCKNFDSAYEKYINHRNAILGKAEEDFYEYCQNPKTFGDYVTGYYGNEGWFAFQRRFGNQNQTSMVDIAARMLGCKIIIHSTEEGQPEIYATALPSPKEIHVLYLGNNHFKVMRQQEILFTIPSETKELESLFPDRNVPSSDGSSASSLEMRMNELLRQLNELQSQRDSQNAQAQPSLENKGKKENSTSTEGLPNSAAMSVDSSVPGTMPPIQNLLSEQSSVNAASSSTTPQFTLSVVQAGFAPQQQSLTAVSAATERSLERPAV